MKRIVISFLSVSFLFGVHGISSAQPSSYLSMEMAVEQAANNSSSVQISDLEHQLASSDYRQTDAVLLPQLNFGYQALVTDNPLNAFGFLLQQEGVTQQSFEPGKLNSPGATHNFGTSVEFRLPLFNLDLLYARKGARMQQDVRRNQLAFTREHVVFETQKAYTQLQFAYQLRNILMLTLEDVRQIFRSVKNFQEQGLVQMSDVLNAQVQVNTVESALARAESNIANVSEGLAVLMGQTINPQEAYNVDSLSIIPAEIIGKGTSASRPDILALKAAVQSSRNMEKSAAMAFLPKVNAFGTYQFNDRNVLGFRHGSYLAGISLSWNVFSGNQNSAKLKSAKLNTAKMQKQLEQLIDNSRLEIEKTQRDLKDGSLEIVKSRTSVEHAIEALRIIHNRYKEGLASTNDWLSAQAQLSQQRITLAQTIMNYNITGYYLKFLTIEY